MDNPLNTTKDVDSFTILTYGWVIFLSIWGGVVNYVNKVKAGTATRFNITELIGDIVTSGFVGVLTFWMCQASAIDPLLTAVMVGVAGHMGARAIAKLEGYIGEKMSLNKLDVSPRTTQPMTTPVFAPAAGGLPPQAPVAPAPAATAPLTTPVTVTTATVVSSAPPEKG